MVKSRMGSPLKLNIKITPEPWGTMCRASAVDVRNWVRIEARMGASKSPSDISTKGVP